MSGSERCTPVYVRIKDVGYGSNLRGNEGIKDHTGYCKPPDVAIRQEQRSSLPQAPKPQDFLKLKTNLQKDVDVINAKRIDVNGDGIPDRFEIVETNENLQIRLRLGANYFGMKSGPEGDPIPLQPWKEFVSDEGLKLVADIPKTESGLFFTKIMWRPTLTAMSDTTNKNYGTLIVSAQAYLGEGIGAAGMVKHQWSFVFSKPEE